MLSFVHKLRSFPVKPLNCALILTFQNRRNIVTALTPLFKAHTHKPATSTLFPLSLIFIVFFSQNMTCLAQTRVEYEIPGYQVKHYTDENGLAQNSVKSIVPDSWGNIWIASEQGLVRFDGRSFVTFEDFGKTSRNIYHFYISPSNAGKEFFASNSDGNYIRIHNGTAVMDTTFRWQLLRLPFVSRTKWATFVTVGLPNDYKELDTPGNYVIPMGYERYFVYTTVNVEYYENKKRIKAFPFKGKKYQEFFRLDDNLYHIDQNQKLVHFPGKQSSSQAREATFTGDIQNNPLFPCKGQCQVFWNNCSNQAFVSLGKSLYMLSVGKNGNITSDLILDGFDFNSINIRTIYFDKKSGKIFLGSQINGLYVIEKRQFQVLTANIAGTDNVYYAQTQLRDGTLLSNQGIKFSWNNESKKMAGSHSPLITNSAMNDKSSILTDRRGFIWCKRYDNLFMFSEDGNKVLFQWKVPAHITQLYEGKNGVIWIGIRGAGLYYINPGDQQPYPKRFINTKFPDISWIQQGYADILWVATYEGLYTVNLKSKKVHYIKGLENIYVRSLHIPNEQNEIWITTSKDGIFLLKRGKLTRFPLDKNKYLSNAHCITEDRKGFFWITTNKGLFQISKDDLLSYARKPFDIYYYYYSRFDGFNINEFNGGCQPCAFRTKDGHVSLPSMDGLVWFVPEQVKPRLADYEINIEEADIDSSRQSLSNKTISLSDKSAELVVKVNVPYFGDVNNLKISYQILKGKKPTMEWKTLDNQNPALSVPSLDPGDYTLRIRKANGFGVNNYSYKNLKIRVEKQWYETWWFRFGILFTALSIFYGILKQRVKKISKQNLILEAKINERTQHLEEALRVLNASGKELEQRGRTQIRLIASVTHDVRNPVRHMTMALRYVQDLIEKDQLEAAISAVKKIEQNSDRIYHLVDNMISFIKPEIYRTNSDFKRANLSALVSERIQIFKEVNGAMINLNISSEHFVNTDPTLLSVVIHNLVDNAIKAKNGNRIEISTENTDAGLYLIFSDEGPGMPTELLHWLNTTSSDENTSLPASYEGLGLLMVKEITKILKVVVHVENNPGARISLKFALDTSK
jgi:signal transduction histidine kinase